MATINVSNITIEEVENISQQILYYEARNEEVKEIICPRCGNYMNLDVVGDSHSVLCESQDCIGYTARGI